MDLVNKEDWIVDIGELFEDVFEGVVDLGVVGGWGNEGGVVELK